MTSDIQTVEKGVWTGRSKVFKGALTFMMFISSIELYYIYEAIPVMQDLYPDENQY